MSASPAFASRVFEIVARIPRGKVTTYGRIARTIGDARGARMVGWALMNGVECEDLPCHRVVNRAGLLTGGWHFGHPDVMRDRLLADGVPFKDDYQVDLDRCVWDPWEDEDGDGGSGVDDRQLALAVDLDVIAADKDDLGEAMAGEPPAVDPNDR